MDILLQARALLRDATPLKDNCGALCGGACCKGSKDDGMLLLPGESALYKHETWCRVFRRNGEDVLVCRGNCPREKRPFSCRIFPLFPRVTAEKASLILDPFAKSVCPLASENLRSLDQNFVACAKQALRLLLNEEAYRAFFMRQTAIRDEAFRDPLFRAFF